MPNRKSVKQFTKKSYLKFKGGAQPSIEKPLVDFGRFSDMQNMRQRQPGLEQRAGQAKLHSTADGTNQVVNGFQYSKGKKTERHTLVQMGDSDVLQADTEPPGTIIGPFGSQVFSGTTGDIPASWSVVDDVLIFSNGSDQHQVWTGEATPVSKFIVYKGTAAIPVIPDGGEDYTEQVTNGSSTVAVLDSLGDFTNDFDAVFIGCPVRADVLNWTISAANGTAAVAELYYWNGAWTDTTMTDNTSVGGKTLGGTGVKTMSWTSQTDEIPKYMFGANLFWYRYNLADSASLDAEVEISAVTFESDFQDIQNVWDGNTVDIIEAQFYDQSAAVYKTFGASAIEVDSMTTSDKLYFDSFDQIGAIYIDVGELPNTTASTTINYLYYWNGAAWAAVSALNDGTSGLSKSGWVTWTQVDSEPLQFNDTLNQAYWYYFTVDKTLNNDVQISIETAPFFDIDDAGSYGNCNTAWQERACYTFNKAPHEIYVSAIKQPMVLNGDDFTILKPGDGRSNAVKCMKKYKNKLMAWQEEKGDDGGTLTLFEGNSVATMATGKTLLSSKIGTFNAKSAVIVDGVLTYTGTDIVPQTHAYFLSHYGVYKCDGTNVEKISDDVRKHFDPSNSTACIRRGYENKMWIGHDSAYNVLLVGLVTGTTSVSCNTFLVYDIVSKTWSYDERAQALSFFMEVEAASSDIPILQISGGVNDGTVYRLNTGTNDVSTAIDAYVRMELSYEANVLSLNTITLRTKTQDDGKVTITPYLNDLEKDQIVLPMVARLSGEGSIRHTIKPGLLGDHISLKFQNDTASQSLYLEDATLEVELYEER